MECEHTLRSRDGAQLFYRLTQRDGSGTVLVMLHGLASNSTRWTEFVEQLQLTQPWDLLRVDLRGHGGSMYRGKISHQIWVDDLKTVMAQHGYRHAVFVGHSLGAQLALHFTHRYPQLTAGLVLIDPIFPDCLQGSLARVARFRKLLPALVSLVQLASKVGLYRHHFPELDLYQLDRKTRELLQNSADVDIAKYYARPLGDIKNLPLANYLQDLNEVTRPLPLLTAIQAPVLVLLSKGVGLSSIQENQKRIALFNQVDTVIIEADHWLLTEKPLEARHAIEQWCNELKL